MLLRKTRAVGLLISNIAKHGQDDSTYEGATVIEPKKAYYEVPIATWISPLCTRPSCRPTICATQQWSAQSKSLSSLWCG